MHNKIKKSIATATLVTIVGQQVTPIVVNAQEVRQIEQTVESVKTIGVLGVIKQVGNTVTFPNASYGKTVTGYEIKTGVPTTYKIGGEDKVSEKGIISSKEVLSGEDFTDLLKSMELDISSKGANIEVKVGEEKEGFRYFEGNGNYYKLVESTEKTMKQYKDVVGVDSIGETKATPIVIDSKEEYDFVIEMLGGASNIVNSGYNIQLGAWRDSNTEGFKNFDGTPTLIPDGVGSEFSNGAGAIGGLAGGKVESLLILYTHINKDIWIGDVDINNSGWGITHILSEIDSKGSIIGETVANGTIPKVEEDQVTISFEGIKDRELKKGETINLLEGVSAKASDNTNLDLTYEVLNSEGIVVENFDFNTIGEYTVNYKANHKGVEAIESCKLNVVEVDVENPNEVEEVNSVDISKGLENATVTSNRGYIIGFKVKADSDEEVTFKYTLKNGEEITNTTKELNFYDKYTTEEVQGILRSMVVNASKDVALTVTLGKLKDTMIYNEAEGHYYELIDDSSRSYIDAKADAGDRSYLGSKGYMATIPNKEVNDFIQNIRRHSSKDGLWVGMEYDTTKKEYVSNNGEPVTYTNWRKDRPSGDFNRFPYIHMEIDGINGWNNNVELTNSGYYMSYICEYGQPNEKLPRPTVNTTSTITIGDTVAPLIGGVKDKTLYVGETIELLEGITISDNLDNLTVEDIDIKIYEGKEPITGDSVLVESIDTSKEGTYTVVYSAIDSSGNKVEHKSVVTVNVKDFLVLGEPKHKGGNITFPDAKFKIGSEKASLQINLTDGFESNTVIYSLNGNKVNVKKAEIRLVDLTVSQIDEVLSTLEISTVKGKGVTVSVAITSDILDPMYTNFTMSGTVMSNRPIRNLLDANITTTWGPDGGSGYFILNFPKHIKIENIQFLIEADSIGSVCNATVKGFRNGVWEIIGNGSTTVKTNTGFEPLNIDVVDGEYTSIRVDMSESKAYLEIGDIKFNNIPKFTAISKDTVVVGDADMVAPTIEGVSDKEYLLNDNINLLEGVTATDNKDGDITKNIKVTVEKVHRKLFGLIKTTEKVDEIDNTIEGEYNVTYTVEDSSGNIATEKSVVNVDKPMEDKVVIDLKEEKEVDNTITFPKARVRSEGGTVNGLKMHFGVGYTDSKPTLKYTENGVEKTVTTQQVVIDREMSVREAQNIVRSIKIERGNEKSFQFNVIVENKVGVYKGIDISANKEYGTDTVENIIDDSVETIWSMGGNNGIATLLFDNPRALNTASIKTNAGVEPDGTTYSKVSMVVECLVDGQWVEKGKVTKTVNDSVPHKDFTELRVDFEEEIVEGLRLTTTKSVGWMHVYDLVLNNEVKKDTITATYTYDSIAPTVTTPKSTKVQPNENINLLEGITVVDDIDGDLTSKVEIKLKGTDGLITEFTPTKEGSYVFEYTITDAKGNTTTVERIINVVPTDKEVYLHIGEKKVEGGKITIPESFAHSDSGKIKGLKMYFSTGYNSAKPTVNYTLNGVKQTLTTQQLNLTQELTVEQVNEILSTLEIVTNNSNSFQFTIRLNANAEGVEDMVYNPQNGNYYKFVSSPNISWENAKIGAEKLEFRGVKGHLATITSAEEQNIFESLTPKAVWLGGTDAKVEGKWEWVTGEPFNYKNWATGQPDNYRGVEDYLQILEASPKWNDLPNAPFVDANEVYRPKGYIVEFETKDIGSAIDSDIEKTITYDITPPTVNEVEDLEITKGDVFDPMNGLEVSDDSGKPVVNIKYTNPNGDIVDVLDTNTVGDWTVHYEIVDLGGNTITVDRIVTIVDSEIKEIDFTIVKDKDTVKGTIEGTKGVDYKLYRKDEIDIEYKEMENLGGTDTKRTLRNILNGTEVFGFTDATVEDKTSPLIEDYFLYRGKEGRIQVEINAEDLPTKYTYKVEGRTKKGTLVEQSSEVTRSSITSGLKGYVYEIDNNTDTVLTSTEVNSEDGVFDLYNVEDNAYLHIKAIDNKGNESETLHLKLKDLSYNNKPRLSTAKNKVLSVGDTFDPMKGVSAYDFEDGDITSKVTFIDADKVNTNKVGAYKVKYRVEDSKGLVMEETVTIHITGTLDLKVNSGDNKIDLEWSSDKNAVNYRVYRTKADGFDQFEYVDVVEPKLEDIGALDVKAPVIEDIYQIEDAKEQPTDTKSVKGTLGLKARDLASTYRYYVQALDKNGEVLNASEIRNGQSKVGIEGYAYSIDDKEDTEAPKTINALTIAEISEAIQGRDGDILHLRAIDNNGNIGGTVHYLIGSKWNTNFIPVIYGVKRYTTYVGTEIDLLEGVTAKDYEDGDITDKIEIVSDIDFNKEGRYEVVYRVTDSDNNIREVVGSVTVVKEMNLETKPNYETNKVDLDWTKFKVRDDVEVYYDVMKYNKEFGTYTSIGTTEGTTFTDEQSSDVRGAKYKGSDKEKLANGNRRVTVHDEDRGYKGKYQVFARLKSNGAIVGTMNDIITGEEKYVEGEIVGGVVGYSWHLSDIREDVVDDIIDQESNVIEFDPKDYGWLHVAPIDRFGNKTDTVHIKLKGGNGWVGDEVIKNTPPTIGAEDRTITVGTEIDIKSVAKATDIEDGDLTEYIQSEVIGGAIDFNEVGTYEVEHSVTDFDGATSTTTSLIEIVEPMVDIKEDNANEWIDVENLERDTIFVGTNYDPMWYVNVTSSKDGDITNKVKYTTNLDTSKVGSYKVYYSVSDSTGKTVRFSRVVDVIEGNIGGTPPSNTTAGGRKPSDTVNYPTLYKPGYVTENGVVVEGYYDHICIYVGEDITQQLKDFFKAYDVEDKDISKFVKRKGIVNTIKPGWYSVQYRVTDSDSNTSYRSISVHVIEDSFTNPDGEVPNPNPDNGNNDNGNNGGTLPPKPEPPTQPDVEDEVEPPKPPAGNEGDENDDDDIYEDMGDDDKLEPPKEEVEGEVEPPKEEDGKPDINIDTNGDGKPDINIDTDGDGKPDINIDTNGDGKPDINIDTNGDGKPDINIDTNGDGEADTDIDTNGDVKPDLNIDTNGDEKVDDNIDKEGGYGGDVELPKTNDTTVFSGLQLLIASILNTGIVLRLRRNKNK